MKSRTTVVAVVAVSLAFIGALQAASAPRDARAPSPAAPPYDASPFATGLAFPAGFTFAPDGRVFYLERFSGEIRILSADGTTDDLFFDVPGIIGSGEDGLLGVALHPDYPTTPQVFAYVTRTDGGAKNQIVRIADNGGTGENMVVIFESETEPGQYHDGGRILFGPDDKLYAVIGDKHDAGSAQDLNADTGKILRMNTDGSVPNDNPDPTRLWFAYGVRNSFGFTFDPMNGRLWESENGPSCNDELNRVPRGRNLGWGPNQSCGTPPKAPKNTNQDGPKPVMPKLFFKQVPALTGVAFCDGCGLMGGQGKLFMGAWNTGDIRRIRLNPERRAVEASTVVYSHPNGIMSIETAPDGTLYFSDEVGIYRLDDA